MKYVNVRELRANTKMLLDEIAAGATIAVTRRNKVVAQIGPPKQALKRLPSMAAFRKKIRVRGLPMSEELRQMRSEERF